MALPRPSLAEKCRAHRRAFKLALRLGITPAEAAEKIADSERRKRCRQAEQKLLAKLDAPIRSPASRTFEDWDAKHMMRD